MTKKYKPPYKYVECLWEDASAHNDTWVHKDEEITPEMVLTRGWLCTDKPGFISIASSVSAQKEGEELVGNVATIPRGMIKELREISVSAIPKRKEKSNGEEVCDGVQN